LGPYISPVVALMKKSPSRPTSAVGADGPPYTTGYCCVWAAGAGSLLLPPQALSITATASGSIARRGLNIARRMISPSTGTRLAAQ
jgi:hypothetical protein